MYKATIHEDNSKRTFPSALTKVCLNSISSSIAMFTSNLQFFDHINNLEYNKQLNTFLLSYYVYEIIALRLYVIKFYDQTFKSNRMI
jgi:hypothetical protein